MESKKKILIYGLSAAALIGLALYFRQGNRPAPATPILVEGGGVYYTGPSKGKSGVYMDESGKIYKTGDPAVGKLSAD